MIPLAFLLLAIATVLIWSGITGNSGLAELQKLIRGEGAFQNDNR